MGLPRKLVMLSLRPSRRQNLKQRLKLNLKQRLRLKQNLRLRLNPRQRPNLNLRVSLRLKLTRMMMMKPVMMMETLMEKIVMMMMTRAPALSCRISHHRDALPRPLLNGCGGETRALVPRAPPSRDRSLETCYWWKLSHRHLRRHYDE